MEISGPFDESEIPEEVKLMALVVTHDFCMSAESFDATAKPTPAQYALAPGDVGFCTKSDSMIDSGFTGVQVVDAEQHADQFPDWLIAFRNGYVLTQWIHNDDPQPHLGWFSRAQIVPLPDPEMFEVMQTYMASLEGPGDFDSGALPFVEPAYRKLMAEQLPQNDKDAQALLCEVCSSANVVVRIWHNTFLETSAVWRVNEEGERKLVRASTDHQDCTLQGEMVCYDCGWSRLTEEDEFEGHSAHDS